MGMEGALEPGSREAGRNRTSRLPCSGSALWGKGDVGTRVRNPKVKSLRLQIQGPGVVEGLGGVQSLRYMFLGGLKVLGLQSYRVQDLTVGFEMQSLDGGVSLRCTVLGRVQGLGCRVLRFWFMGCRV